MKIYHSFPQKYYTKAIWIKKIGKKIGDEERMKSVFFKMMSLADYIQNLGSYNKEFLPF